MVSIFISKTGSLYLTNWGGAVVPMSFVCDWAIMVRSPLQSLVLRMVTDEGSGLFLGILFFHKVVPESQQPLQREKDYEDLISGEAWGWNQY